MRNKLTQVVVSHVLKFSLVLLLATRITSAAQDSVADFVIYRYLLGHIAFLEKEADRKERQGRPSESLRYVYAKKVGLTDVQGAALRSVALMFESALRAKDKEIELAVRVERQRVQKDIATTERGRLAIPPVLARLQTERNLIVINHVAQLRKQLDSGGFERLDRFAHKEFLKDLTVRDHGSARKKPIARSATPVPNH